jgi:chromosome partitioning protein
MKVISVLNIKGGVGKTVSTVNIAAELGKQGNNVLVIDLDPQANATKYLNLYKNNTPSTYELLKGEDLNYINVTDYPGVSLVPSNIRLILSEAEILADTKKARETRLRKWVKGHKDKFDYIIIDCPPSLGILTTNALAASDFVLVPLKIDKFALDGFEYLLASIEETKEEFNEDLKLLGVFVTMDKRTKINNEIKAELKTELGKKFFNQSIRENVDVTKSTFKDTPVVYFNKNANASKDYKALVEEIKQCLI